MNEVTTLDSPNRNGSARRLVMQAYLIPPAENRFLENRELLNPVLMLGEP